VFVTIAAISGFAANPRRVMALAIGIVMLASASPASAVVQITELRKVAIEEGNLVIVGKTRVAGQTAIAPRGAIGEVA
jgi:hypothetical protein